MIRPWLAVAALFAGPAVAQDDVTITPLPPADLPTLEPANDDDIDSLIQSLESEGAQTEAPEPQTEVANGSGAVLRGLDKLNATVQDLTIRNNGSERLGRIEVAVLDCRYPTDNPQANAYAYLTIREVGATQPVFQGWMIADSPALNPLDHPRYDVWVIRCTTS